MYDSGTQHSCADYARALRGDIPSEQFRRDLYRLAWLPVHLAIIALAVRFVLTSGSHGGRSLLVSAILGHSYGCLMFLAHEILHGTIVKSAGWQNWLSGLCMLPYCIGPAHWKAWHNRAHHGHTSVSGSDPDSFGNVMMFMNNRVARFTLTFAPGSGYRRSYLFLGFWFSFHAIITLFIHGRRYDDSNGARRSRQIALFFLMAGFWAAVLTLVGPARFLLIYVFPMVIANVLQMSYISTNHLFCDETEHVNDPLLNSLSVSVPRWVHWLHLNFGYHVEHHIFPFLSPRHAPRVRAAIEARYGRLYRNLPLMTALRVLYRTPPVHLSQNETVDLETGDVYQTLGERGELPHKIDRVPVPVRPRRRAVTRLHGCAPAVPLTDSHSTATVRCGQLPAACAGRDADAYDESSLNRAA
ncbi:MAG: fatty acid desaturase family protein [Deltaproteobacteria bacterium]